MHEPACRPARQREVPAGPQNCKEADMSNTSYERLRSMYQGGRADLWARRYARFWSAVMGFGLLPRR